jgi:hypothetical protein
MPSTAQLQLGGPFFLAATIIVNALRDSPTGTVGVEPPRVQSIMTFVTLNNLRAARHRKRNAMAAVIIVADFFTAADVRAPAGVCPDRQGPGCLNKLPVWLRQLAQLDATEALQRLAEHSPSVSAKLWARVETEYNTGARAARCGLALLRPGELATMYASLFTTSAGREMVSGNLPVPSTGVGTPRPMGTFYYIAAGVGCGIKEAEKVCAARMPSHVHICTRVYMTALQPAAAKDLKEASVHR